MNKKRHSIIKNVLEKSFDVNDISLKDFESMIAEAKSKGAEHVQVCEHRDCDDYFAGIGFTFYLNKVETDIEYSRRLVREETIREKQKKLSIKDKERQIELYQKEIDKLTKNLGTIKSAK